MVVELTRSGPGTGSARRAHDDAVHAYCMHQRYHDAVPVSVSIRDVPDETRAELAARAARAGQSLQEYLRAQLIEWASKPNPDELWARVRNRIAATGSRLSAEEILEARDSERR